MAKTIDELMNEVRGVLQQQGSNLATFPDYGNLYIIFRAIASIVAEQDSHLDNIYEALFINTSTNQNLDERAKEYGLERNEGDKATGSVIVESDSNTALRGGFLIREGTVLLNPFTNKQYIVTQTISINSTRTIIPVESLEQSSTSNLNSGTKLISNFYRNVNFVVGESFNRITNQYEGDITGGSEKEGDESLRRRILDVIQIKQSSTKLALDSTARLINGVNHVLIEENTPSVGYITIYIDNTNFDVINEVKLKTERIKPPGIILSVKPFETVAVNIDINIALSNKDNLNVKDSEIRSSITNFISTLNKTITKESLAGLLLNSNYVSNVEVISPNSSVTISSKQKFITGSINIQYI